MRDVEKPVEMERGEVVEELLRELWRCKRCINRLEDLLRRWSMGKQRKCQEERERNIKEGDKMHEETEGKVDEELREKKRRKKTEDRGGREKRKEEEDAREEFGYPGRSTERPLCRRYQREGRGIKDRNEGKMEERIGRAEARKGEVKTEKIEKNASKKNVGRS